MHTDIASALLRIIQERSLDSFILIEENISKQVGLFDNEFMVFLLFNVSILL
jgi:hypothetical protein